MAGVIALVIAALVGIGGGTYLRFQGEGGGTALIVMGAIFIIPAMRNYSKLKKGGNDAR